MKTLTYKTNINASPEKIWNCLLDEEKYKIWTAPFCPGSYYKTKAMEVGNRIHFLNPEGGGMYSTINSLIPNREVSFLHIGEIKNFEEMPLDSESEKWTNALEKYEIIHHGTYCELCITMEILDEYSEYMDQSFPLELDELKRISEA